MMIYVMLDMLQLDMMIYVMLDMLQLWWSM